MYVKKSIFWEKIFSPGSVGKSMGIEGARIVLGWESLESEQPARLFQIKQQGEWDDCMEGHLVDCICLSYLDSMVNQAIASGRFNEVKAA